MNIINNTLCIKLPTSSRLSIKSNVDHPYNTFERFSSFYLKGNHVIFYIGFNDKLLALFNMRSHTVVVNERYITSNKDQKWRYCSSIDLNIPFLINSIRELISYIKGNNLK